MKKGNWAIPARIFNPTMIPANAAGLVRSQQKEEKLPLSLLSARPPE